MQLVRVIRFNVIKFVNLRIVLSEYLYQAAGQTPSAWQEKGVAVAGMTVIALRMLNSLEPEYF